MSRIDRITKMENNLDVSAAAVRKLEEALDEYEAALPAYFKLMDYYTSHLWMDDYEADEAGKLPEDLKRGVLAEDTVYDLFTDNRLLVARMTALISKLIEKNRL